MEKYIHYFCENCRKDTEICFTLYDHTEYFADEICPECNKPIPQKVLDKIYSDEPIDWISSKIDRAHDMMKDS